MLVGAGVGMIIGAGVTVYVGRGGCVGVAVEVGCTVVVGVGSGCSHASSATASTRLDTKMPSKDAVLGCIDAEMKIRVRLRKGLDSLARINDESIA